MNIQQTTPTPKLVTMIPADPQMAERDLRKKHLRVAPYCRVSTDKEEQLSSYEAQIEYYTEKIDANPDWTMVRLYADEGITGTSAKKRKDYDEELRQVNMAKTKLMAKKAELEKEQRGAAAFEERLAELDAELEQSCGALTDFDELTVRQLVSNIKVLDKDSLLICFKDGTEITQAMQRRQTA